MYRKDIDDLIENAENGTERGLALIAAALMEVAAAIHRLGLAEASTPMGAIEVLAKEVKESGEAIASALDDVASAIKPQDF